MALAQPGCPKGAAYPALASRTHSTPGQELSEIRPREPDKKQLGSIAAFPSFMDWNQDNAWLGRDDEDTPSVFEYDSRPTTVLKAESRTDVRSAWRH